MSEATYLCGDCGHETDSWDDHADHECEGDDYEPLESTGPVGDPVEEAMLKRKGRRY